MVTRRSKRVAIDDDEDNDNNASEKKELSIPKKPRIAQTTGDEEGKIKKETPSLLSGMKKPPMPKTNVSGGEKGAHETFKKAIKPPHSSRTVSDSSLASRQMPIPPSRTPSTSSAPTPTQTKVDSTQGSGLRQLVFDGLRDLCNEVFEKPPIRHGADLSASFLRHKDLNPTKFTSGVNEDGTNGLQYDFFDVDENTGTIVLQPKIPIFPEDFPAGSKEWPLSWWGIVEPSVEEKKRDDKERSKNSNDAENHSRSRRDRISVRSEIGRDDKGDRYRGDNSRNTRRLSSRDRYDDEYGQYNDYPRREERHDRYPGGQFNDFRDGYPPHPHGREFDHDYDRNGRPPNRYPESHPPHDHGGRQPFPPRSRDGPHSRPYPFDGPPPGPPRGEFRGGGGRPYPEHGSGGPPSWDYPHRDPHGPPGRGPPPPRDDRRDYRDRPHRSPPMNTERDDGRHSGRSSRKDRPRPSR